VFFDGKNYVLLYQDDCNIDVREVSLLTGNNGITYIESGLDENEKIITKNQLLIFEELRGGG
jgi:cobalt-zinc-cadmium efflux system membrane fusion protein